jgi:hypothetical protein
MVPGASSLARAAPTAAEAEAFRSGVVPAGSGGCAAGVRVSMTGRRVGVRRRLEVLGDGGLGRRRWR